MDIYDLASLPGLFLSDEDAAQFFVKVHDTQAHLTWLMQWAIANEQQRWNIVYKLHLGHIAEQAQWLSPRAGSTYIDEDFMGRMKMWPRNALVGVHCTDWGTSSWLSTGGGCSSGGV